MMIKTPCTGKSQISPREYLWHLIVPFVQSFVWWSFWTNTVCTKIKPGWRSTICPCVRHLSARVPIGGEGWVLRQVWNGLPQSKQSRCLEQRPERILVGERRKGRSQRFPSHLLAAGKRRGLCRPSTAIVRQHINFRLQQKEVWGGQFAVYQALDLLASHLQQNQEARHSRPFQGTGFFCALPKKPQLFILSEENTENLAKK